MSIFHNVHTCITTQIRDKWTPFSIGFHYSSYRMNLAMQTLANFPMVSWLESILHSMRSYFCRSNKCHAKFQKLNFKDIKGNKILRNIITCWIFMRSPTMRVLAEYWTFIVKMEQDMMPMPNQKTPTSTVENFNFLIDLEVLLSLSYIQPFLSSMHSLIKFSQAQEVFIVTSSKV
jgi:hypothetical protein